MCMRMSVIHYLELKTVDPYGFSLADWSSKERFGSEKVKFPVMGIFGGKDYFIQPRGFDKVIEYNRYY